MGEQNWAWGSQVVNLGWGWGCVADERCPPSLPPGDPCIVAVIDKWGHVLSHQWRWAVFSVYLLRQGDRYSIYKHFHYNNCNRSIYTQLAAFVALHSAPGCPKDWLVLWDLESIYWGGYELSVNFLKSCTYCLYLIFNHSSALQAEFLARRLPLVVIGSEVMV